MLAWAGSDQLPVELSENMLQNLFLNLPPQTVLILQCLSYREMVYRVGQQLVAKVCLLFFETFPGCKAVL